MRRLPELRVSGDNLRYSVEMDLEGKYVRKRREGMKPAGTLTRRRCWRFYERHGGRQGKAVTTETRKTARSFLADRIYRCKTGKCLRAVHQDWLEENQRTNPVCRCKTGKQVGVKVTGNPKEGNTKGVQDASHEDQVVCRCKTGKLIPSEYEGRGKAVDRITVEEEISLPLQNRQTGHSKTEELWNVV